MNVIIPRRFCGPPTSGNGGYTCGLVARALGGNAEVTLRRPIPIEQEMTITVSGDSATLKLGEDLIAEGKRAEWSLALAHRASFSEAIAAAKRSPAFQNHPFPTCFVCGPDRAEGDGLRIFPGNPNGQRGIFAAPWIPAAEFADNEGNVLDVFIWAAMDCPTGFAAGFPWAGKLVTGRLAVNFIAPVRAGEHCVAVSWKTGEEGRKHHASAALLGEDGSVRAHAKATWIKID
jgi:hypothetical protein